jgi:hypothetical protein
MGTRRIRTLVPVVVLAFGLCTAASASAAVVNVKGEWHVNEYVFHEGKYVSGPDTNEYSIPLEESEGNFSGSVYNYGYRIRGRVTGSEVLFTVAHEEEYPYTQVYKGTIASGGEIMEGISASCPDIEGEPAIYEGTWTMSLPMATAPEPPNTVDRTKADALCGETSPTGPDLRDGTSTTVVCYRGAAVSSDSTCVATVLDTASTPSTPTGTVSFSVEAANGSLPDGSSCGPLVAVAGAAASSASCSVTFQPGAGGTPAPSSVPIQASYSGDSAHKPSQAASASVVVGAAPSQPTTGPGTTPTPLPAPLELTFTDCENFAAAATAGSVPAGDYTGPEGAYGTKAERFVACEQLVGLSFVAGANWSLVDTVGGAIDELELGSRWVHRFQVYVPTQDGWQAAAAQISPWSQAQYAAYKTGAADPPSPAYEVLARVAVPKLPKIRVAGTSSARTAAKDLNKLTAELGSTRAIAEAFQITVDRAGGAKQAGNAAWQGRQTRLAVSFANQLSAGYARLVPLVETASRLAAHAPLAHGSISRSALQRIRAQIARSGLTSAERSRLRALGFGSSQLAALVHAARQTSVATAQLESSPAELLSDPRFMTDLQNLELFFRLWPQRAEVLANAALGQ